MKLNREDNELIQKAKDIIEKSKPVNLIDTSEVGSSLITSRGNIYSGVSLGFYCGIGSCGEYQAVGAMISNGEKNIKTIVAVDDSGNVMPPCGKCREMMLQASKDNKNTDVIISRLKKIKLKDLMPYAWGGSIEKNDKRH
jgi:cytidine deaminase